MAIRLEQMHPAVVHLPVALLPLSVGADLVGRLSGKRALLSFGQATMCVAALGASGSVLSGLIAGEEVNVKGASMDMLMTHRNLNVAAAVIVGSMALWRDRHGKPTLFYLASGVAGVGILMYTSYLGGKLVYETGVGVEPAGGVYRADAPTLKPGRTGRFSRMAATDFVHGVQHMVQEVKKGNIAPTVMAMLRNRSTASHP